MVRTVFVIVLLSGLCLSSISTGGYILYLLYIFYKPNRRRAVQLYVRCKAVEREQRQSNREKPKRNQLETELVQVSAGEGPEAKQVSVYPFPVAPLISKLAGSAAWHRSRWFQRFGTIPGSLDI